MGKNSKNRRANKTSAQKRRQAPVSLSSFRASRALDALAPAYVQWFDDGTPGAGAAALQYLKLMEPTISRYVEMTAAPDMTSLDPATLANAVAEEVSAAAGAQAPEVVDAEQVALIVDSVHSYVEFLSETGRWTGTEELLAEVLEFFDSLADGVDGQETIEIPDIPEDQALSAFTEMPLIQKATALLEWIGEGKPVTGTGALRLRDIEEAAACVGVQTKGGSKKDSAGDVLTVRSMYEVPLLAEIWAALQAAELIRVKPTKVVPFEDHAHFLDGSVAEQVDEFTMFTSLFLEQAVLRLDPEEPWERTIAAIQVSVLLAAATAEPLLVERVLAAPDHAPEEEKKAAELLTKVAMGRLEELAELGLLTIDTHFRVPPALIRCVADAFDDPSLLAELGLGESPLEEAFDDEEAEAPEVVTAGNPS
ncbi:hypothetical protein QF038_001687 [Pseudarthrobacter sp. W1I19]|uniref:hypothetical protein n=1 Tax=Pseudarthrobacter sp. W1I19 TaxID=3042288 RepID=UPI002781853C|nr:hypothetical protein [Pseudarthrobacter sp. W1I19]MDQ0923179.1 hypothetical protein [Pseudarthrobacter sp. W1I19]